MIDVKSLHKYMELDQLSSISTSTSDIQIIVLSSQYPGIYFRSCDQGNFTTSKTHGNTLTIAQRFPIWRNKADRGRPSLSWLWTHPSLVIALSQHHILDELNIQVSSGSARIDGINVRKLGGQFSGGSLQIQHSSCISATFSVTNSSISSTSLQVKEECSISASSSRVTLYESHQPENGYHVKSINGSLLLGSRCLSGTVVEKKAGTPLYVIESDASRVEIL